MIAAIGAGLLKAAPYLLQGASLAGGIFGKKRKFIDPEYLRSTFGPAAVTKDAQELANYLLNSTYGQQLMASAAESGQQFQTNLNAAAAQSGLDPSSGGESGASTFATAAAPQAQASFERGVKSNIFQSALPVAAQMVAGRQAAYLDDQAAGGTPTEGAQMWNAIGNTAGNVAAMIPAGAPKAKLPTQTLQEETVKALSPAGTEAALAPAMARATQSQAMRRLSARRKTMQSMLTGLGAVQRTDPTFS